jgi:putative transposase
MVKPSRRGPMVERLVGSYQVSERHACRVLCVPRATYRYRSCLDPRTELRIREIAQARVRYGYRKIRVLLNREGWNVGKYLVYLSLAKMSSGLPPPPYHTVRVGHIDD